MKTFLFVKQNLGLIAPFLGLIIGVLWIAILKNKKNKLYKIETLKRNGLANDFTILKRNRVHYPNASSSSFNAKIELICQLQENNKIINCKSVGQKIIFEEANFKKSKNVSRKIIKNEIGIDHNNKVFSPREYSISINVPSESGKTVLINNKIFSFIKQNRTKNFEIVIGDSHSSFMKLKKYKDIISIFSLENNEEKHQFLEKLKDIKKYQQNIDLSVHESLEGAQSKNQLLDIKSYLIICDEFFENYSSPSSKHQDFHLNQDTIKALENLITSGRKYNQQVWVASQAVLNSETLISPSLFQAQIFGYLSEETATAKKIPANHPLLKEPGVFYYLGKKSQPCFFKSYLILKEDLPILISEVLNALRMD